MPSINQTELEQLLRNSGRSQFVSLTSVTNPNMRIRNNPWAAKDDDGRMLARKVTIARGSIGFKYSSTVRRQQARESKPATFVAAHRSWGNRIQGTPLVSQIKGEEPNTVETLYLEVKLQSRGEHYFDRNTGRRIELSELETWLREASVSERQQLERDVLLRDYKITNIAEITLNGKRYTIGPAATELNDYLPKAKPTCQKAAARTNRTSVKSQPSGGSVA